MPKQPFAIGPRLHPDHFPDGKGGGQASHMRHINGRTYFFEWFWNAEGSALYRVRILVPNPAPGISEGWYTSHELISNQPPRHACHTSPNSVKQRALTRAHA